MVAQFQRGAPIALRFQRHATSAVWLEILMAQRLSATREDRDDLRPPPKKAITLQVNGVPRDLTVAPWTTLLDALRDLLVLTGTKKGCDQSPLFPCTTLFR